MTIDQTVARWTEMVNEGCFYDNSIPGRCLPWASHHGRDCSTFAADGIDAGFPGAVDLCSNSFSQAAWCYDTPRPDWFTKRFGPGVGTFITKNQAMHVVCLGFRGTDFGRRPDSTGDGHTECILGQGTRTVGAHSHATGVGFDNNGINTHLLSFFAVPPPFLAEMAGPPLDKATIIALEKLAQWEKRVAASPLELGDTNGDATIANALLIHGGWMGKGRQSNTFNRHTRAALTNMKRERHLEGGGKRLGGDAAHALLQG